MRKIIVNDEFKGYVDNVIFVRLNKNGSYVPTAYDNAGGFCFDLLVEKNDENGNIIESSENVVCQFQSNSLKGTEPIGSCDEVSAVAVLKEKEQEIIASEQRITELELIILENEVTTNE